MYIYIYIYIYIHVPWYCRAVVLGIYLRISPSTYRPNRSTHAMWSRLWCCQHWKMTFLECRNSSVPNTASWAACGWSRTVMMGQLDLQLYNTLNKVTLSICCLTFNLHCYCWFHIQRVVRDGTGSWLHRRFLAMAFSQRFFIFFIRIIKNERQRDPN